MMSEENFPAPEEVPAKSGKGVWFALVAGILGLAAGAGLYALSDGPGNGRMDSETRIGMAENVNTGSDENAGTCAVDAAMRSKIDRAATGELAGFKAIDRPYSLTDLPFKDTNGVAKTLADWNGRTVLFNLWATWCVPCRAEMPALDHLQGSLGGEDFEVVAVSVDLGDDAKPKKFYADLGLKNLGFYHDPDLTTLNSMKKGGLAFGLPATVLIDENGCVLGNLNGPAEWGGEDAKRLIKEAM